MLSLHALACIRKRQMEDTHSSKTGKFQLNSSEYNLQTVVTITSSVFAHIALLKCSSYLSYSGEHTSKYRVREL